MSRAVQGADSAELGNLPEVGIGTGTGIALQVISSISSAVSLIAQMTLMTHIGQHGIIHYMEIQALVIAQILCFPCT
jgi:hypothetical protein